MTVDSKGDKLGNKQSSVEMLSNASATEAFVFDNDDPSEIRSVPRKQPEISTKHGNLSGRVIGAYRLLEILGEGGMGQVYLAEHLRLGRRVALKMLLPKYAEDAEAVQRFFGEAKAVNQISHEHIISITDFIEEEGQPACYIMELLEGDSLETYFQREKQLEPEALIRIGIQIASAMAAVHDAFIIHRDLKPDNIFLTTRAGRTDYVKLLDFGVAKLTEAHGSTAKTQVGIILGTPDYMAPEQFEGLELDQRTDIYALGVIFYEMLTGRKPFIETSIGALAVATITKKATPINALENAPNIPFSLDALVMKCLEKSPDRRPQSMAAIEERLKAIVLELTGWEYNSSGGNSGSMQQFNSGSMPRSNSGSMRQQNSTSSRKNQTTTGFTGAYLVQKKKKSLAFVLSVSMIILIAAVYVLFFVLEPKIAKVEKINTEYAGAEKTEEVQQFSLNVVTQPEGAELIIDDESMGRTPYKGVYKLSTSPLKIKLTKKGYQIIEKEIIVDKNQSFEFSLKSSVPAARPKSTQKKVIEKQVVAPVTKKTTREPKKRSRKKRRKDLLDPFAD